MNVTASLHRSSFAATLRLHGEDGLYTKAEGGDPINIRAVRGATPFREGSNTLNGGRIVRSADFLFDLNDFHTKVGRWPADGDTFRVAPPGPVAGIAETTFRVTPTNGEPVYRAEHNYTQLRIHCHESEETTE